MADGTSAGQPQGVHLQGTQPRSENADFGRVRLRLLGGFEFTVDGRRVDLQPLGERVLAMVALALRGIDRSLLAFQLWPNKTEARAKANLRSALWRLGSVEAATIDATKHRLRLHSSVWVDTRDGLDEFLDTPADDIAVIEVDLLGRDLLPGWYDDWLDVERERLRQLHLAILEQRASNALAGGNTCNAIQFGLAAVAIDPFREFPHRLVINAHLAEGNRHEAQREYDRYRAQLAVDASLTPSNELQLLFSGAA